MSAPVEMIPMHFAGRSTRGRAAGFVTRDGARDLVEVGLATWDKKARAITLNRTEATIKLRDLSCQMGFAVIEQAVMGSAYHQALVDAWA